MTVNLMSMPMEIHGQIVENMDIATLNKFTRTCKTIYVNPIAQNILDKAHTELVAQCGVIQKAIDKLDKNHKPGITALVFVNTQTGDFYSYEDGFKQKYHEKQKMEFFRVSKSGNLEDNLKDEVNIKNFQKLNEIAKKKLTMAVNALHQQYLSEHPVEKKKEKNQKCIIS